MLLAYLVASLAVGLFGAYIWSSNGFANICIKTVLSIYTIWTTGLLLGQIAIHVQHTALRLF